MDNELSKIVRAGLEVNDNLSLNAINETMIGARRLHKTLASIQAMEATGRASRDDDFLWQLIAYALLAVDNIVYSFVIIDEAKGSVYLVVGATKEEAITKRNTLLLEIHQNSVSVWGTGLFWSNNNLLEDADDINSILSLPTEELNKYLAEAEVHEFANAIPWYSYTVYEEETASTVIKHLEQRITKLTEALTEAHERLGLKP